jgi:hypothetical protein
MEGKAGGGQVPIISLSNGLWWVNVPDASVQQAVLTLDNAPLGNHTFTWRIINGADKAELFPLDGPNGSPTPTGLSAGIESTAPSRDPNDVTIRVTDETGRQVCGDFQTEILEPADLDPVAPRDIPYIDPKWGTLGWSTILEFILVDQFQQPVWNMTFPMNEQFELGSMQRDNPQCTWPMPDTQGAANTRFMYDNLTYFTDLMQAYGSPPKMSPQPISPNGPGAATSECHFFGHFLCGSLNFGSGLVVNYDRWGNDQNGQQACGWYYYLGHGRHK